MTTRFGNQRAALPFILLTVFIDVIGVGLMIPVLPTLVGQLAGNAADQAHWYGAIMMTYGLLQFFCTPLLGALSDRFGRRPVLLLSITGLGFSYIVTATTTSLWMLLLTRVVSGATGASFSVAHAYVADITTPEERSRGFGLIGATLGLGFIIGPALGGVLTLHSLRLPFEVAAVLALLNALYGYFVLPESLPESARRPLVWRQANPFSALAYLSRLHGVGLLLVVFALSGLAQWMLQTCWVLFTSYRFAWTPTDNGIALCLVGLTSVVAQGFLLKPLMTRWGERRIALAGMLSAGLVQVGYGLSTQDWLMYVLIPLNFLSFAVTPALQAIVSRAADAGEQGLAIGSLNAITSIATVIAPLLGTGLMARASHLPPMDWQVGMPFYLAALLQFIGLALAIRHFRTHAEQAPRPDEATEIV